MANNQLWSSTKSNNFLSKFVKYINNKYQLRIKNYNDLHIWSIKNKKEFWLEAWNFTSIIGQLKEPIIKNEKNFIKSTFF